VNDNIRRHRLVGAALLSVTLVACGGGSGSDDNPTSTAPPFSPMPALSYSSDANVCAWMAAHVQPFTWPTSAVGPRNWLPATVQTVDTPTRNAQGLVQYRVTSNLMVLQGHYTPQIQAKGIAYSSSQLWAQEAACKYGISVDSQTLTALSNAFTAYMPDSTAARVAQEDYTAGIQQVRKSDPCRPEVVLTGVPLPPECRAGS
jgi:hypothetical protein